MTDKPQFVEERGQKVKLNNLCSRGKSSLRQKDVSNDGPYAVYGASGLVGTMASFQNAVPYVAVVKDGAGVGRASACEAKTSVLGTMQALIPSEGIDRDYLLHLVRSLHLGDGFSGSTIPHIYFKDYGKLPVRLHSPAEQKRIVDIFASIERQIKVSKQQLDQLDSLVKSRFVEMFGTPDNNIHSLPIKTMGGISEQLIAGGDKPRKISKNKDLKHPYPVFANGTIADGLQGFSEEARVNKSAVTIAARGTIGFCLVREPGFTPIVRLISLVPKPSINVVYLKYFIDLLNLAGSGSSQAQLTLPAFREQQILVPELKEQLEFATFVAQVDKSRFVAQQQIEKLQMLYDSLAQEYFGD
ncbi:restriction endonuclease subunit S [Bifidobacterium adolescentis]|uniref:restriction endonuclease subunit S n=1 Tax=Bifidobacterium adolescentis TaxID=1680 RepID=UPI000E4E0044|nr:restriction endonuclease subunit S [Bifidobacterium adolescentis]RGV14576.1 restriction endonuclease subunit S [Bifidobacterium adolescentis]